MRATKNANQKSNKEENDAYQYEEKKQFKRPGRPPKKYIKEVMEVAKAIKPRITKDVIEMIQSIKISLKRERPDIIIK